jgi:hypothetical protein
MSFLLEKDMINLVQSSFLSIVLVHYNKNVNYVINNFENIRQILAISKNPDKYFFGFLKKVSIYHSYVLDSKNFEKSNTKELNLLLNWPLYYAFALKGDILSKNEFNEMDGPSLVIPKGLYNLLKNTKTYPDGVKELRIRYASKRFILTSEIPFSFFSNRNIFNQSDSEYEDRMKILHYGIDPEQLKKLKTMEKNLTSFRNYEPYQNMVDTILHFFEGLRKEKVRPKDDDFSMFFRIKLLLNPFFYWCFNLRNSLKYWNFVNNDFFSIIFYACVIYFFIFVFYFNNHFPQSFVIMPYLLFTTSNLDFVIPIVARIICLCDYIFLFIYLIGFITSFVSDRIIKSFLQYIHDRETN